MTREEREKHLDWLYRLKSEIFVFMPKDWLIPMADALDMSIKVLEQEPTTKNDLGVDAISREKAIKWAKFYTEIYDAEVANKEIMKMLREIPSVTPQEPILDRVRAEIAEYGSIWVEYKITGRRDMDIEQLVGDVLKQAKNQVLEVIDKYKGESEG